MVSPKGNVYIVSGMSGRTKVCQVWLAIGEGKSMLLWLMSSDQNNNKNENKSYLRVHDCKIPARN